jgi:alpha-N-arabinofuranosidase
VAALRAIQIPNLRWPGGCFADDYHWRDGIGSKPSRPKLVNRQWGDVIEDNSFGTHEFMDLCEQLDAEPYITGNIGSGTVREMSEWAEYLTQGAGESPLAELRRENGREEPWRVRFWGLGNEPWGCGGNMLPAHYADLARQYGSYVRDHGGNKFYRVAAGPGDDDYAWTLALMQSLSKLGKCCNGGQFQALSLHYYTFNGTFATKGDAVSFDKADFYVTMRRAQRMGEIIRRNCAIMDAYNPCKTVGLVVDEWGTWWDVEPGSNPAFLYQQNTLRDALVASVHFDIFHASCDRVVMANIAQTVNVLQAMLLIDPDTGQLITTPTYHVFEMNTGHHDANSLAVAWKGDVPAVEVEGSRVPLVSASASVKGDRALVSLSNLDADKELALTLDLRGREVVGWQAKVLTAPQVQAHNTAADPAAVSPAVLDEVARTASGLQVRLPRHSYATLSLKLA